MKINKMIKKMIKMIKNVKIRNLIYKNLNNKL